MFNALTSPIPPRRPLRRLARALAIETLLVMAWGCSLCSEAQDRTNSPPAPVPPSPVSWEDIKARWSTRPRADIQAAAEQGDATAQHYLGRFHFEGLGGVTNRAEGIKWYRRAASQGLPNALNNLGLAHLNGQGVPLDKMEGRRLIQQAAQLGDAGARRNLASLQADGVGGPREEAAARLTLEQLAKGGDPRAQYELGRFLMSRKGVSLEVKNAMHWYRKAAEQGLPDACAELGRLYTLGWGMKPDFEEALIWFRQGAAAGHAHSMHLLAWACVEGRGVKPDRAEGMKWMLAAAEGGDAGAHTDLGRLYELRDVSPAGTPPDLARAAEWYRKGVQLREADSAFRLARLAREGRIQASPENRLEWLRLAADLNHREALVLLADLIAQGEVKGRNADETPLQIYWRLSRSGGNVEDLLHLAGMYRQGNGAPKDPVLSASFYFQAFTRSADLEDEVMRILRPGNKPAQDPESKALATLGFEDGVAMFMRAVEGGDVNTQLEIARRYLKGEGGLPRDEREAFAWYSIAAAKGAQGAADEAARLRQSLNEIQLSDAAERVSLVQFAQDVLRQRR